MTTIYELDKQATPAPWTHESDMIDVSDQAQMLLDNIGTDREWQAIGINDAEGFAEVTALCHPEHAKLLVHYHNHFMEALEALKHAHAILESEYDPKNEEDGRHPDQWGLTELIAKLETVE